MNAYPYYALIVAGIIFGFVSLMHLLRLVYKARVIIAEKTIPIWISGIGFILPLILSIWMFMASCSSMQGHILADTKLMGRYKKRGHI